MSVEFLNDPFVWSAVLATVVPLGVALVSTIVLGALAGPRWAGVGIVVAFVFAYVAILGWPSWPPRSSLQKIAYVCAFGVLAGAVIAMVSQRPSLLRISAAAWSAILVLWVGSQRLGSAEWFDALVLILLWAGGTVAFERLATYRDAEIVAPTMLVAAGIGVSLAAMLGSAASLSQLAAVVATATGGYLLCNWPKRRHVFSLAAAFGTASALFAVVVSAALFTRSSKIALALAVLVFLTGMIRDRSPLFQRSIAGPVAFAFAAGLPMLLMIAAAYLASGGAGG